MKKFWKHGRLVITLASLFILYGSAYANAYCYPYAYEENGCVVNGLDCDSGHGNYCVTCSGGGSCYNY